MGKRITDYLLVSHGFDSCPHERLTREIENERGLHVTPDDLLMSLKLNCEQKHAYDLILAACFSAEGQAFFIDGPGGIGKTFLYRSLLAALRSQGYIAIAVATSGIAASILPGGRTAHSRFKISLDFSKNKTCQLSKQSSVAKLLFECKLILWDEASMAKREMIEAYDDLLRDTMDSDLSFGGKVVVFGGDFRQTLPFLLRIGEGKELVDGNGEITLPPDIVIPYYDKEQSLNRLLESVFPDLHLYSKDSYTMINRCILAPKNSSVDELNELLINRFPGNLQRLCLAVMQEKVFIPKIPLQTSDNERNGIPFIRTQFPARLCFALTINKSQGQTLDYIGLYLCEPIFSHGQLYVALSRARTAAELKVLLVPGTFDERKTDCKTRNIVFNEIFYLTQQ
nr:uncharacterized protein LOC113724311 [Coffea arabica]